MSLKRETIRTVGDLAELERRIAAAAAATAEKLSRELRETSDLSAFARLKFSEAGCDPLDLDRALNFNRAVKSILHIFGQHRSRKMASRTSS